MVKKKSSPAKKNTTSKKRETRSNALTIAIAVIVLLAVVVLGSWGVKSVINMNNQARLDRIESIYSSLALSDEEYPVDNYNVFGDKRTYEWDSGRSYSSAVQYVHGDTVTNTFNDLDAKIRKAGFTFVDEPYPGSVQKQYHYKSEKGEYLRLSVSSKLYDDAIRNAAIMGQDIATVVDDFTEGTDKGPANVVIKVNLDDNNE